MKKTIAYLLIVLGTIAYLMVAPYIYILPAWYMDNILYAQCAYMGAVGGILYCLRGVYLSRAVRKNWDTDWEVWYYLRPIASTISGFVSVFFLKAGLLVLSASAENNTLFGYYALAFIAGFNVDNFLKRIESVAQSAIGIKQSRSSDLSEKED